MNIVFGVILLVAALFLVVAVLLQHGKDHNLSGTIAGAGESFFGKSKGSTVDRKLSVLTTVVSIVFVVLVLVVYLRYDNWAAKKVNAGTPAGADAAVTQTTGDGTEKESELPSVENTEELPSGDNAADVPPEDAPANTDAEAGN